MTKLSDKNFGCLIATSPPSSLQLHEPSPDIEILRRLLEERGFALSAGTCTSSRGRQIPMYQIKRPDTPEWEGAWMPWLAHSSSEAQTVLSLTCEAFAKWHGHNQKKDPRISILSEFIEKVGKSAENKMLKTGKLEGAHYAAMKQFLLS
jgi:hypothetical protein